MTSTLKQRIKKLWRRLAPRRGKSHDGEIDPDEIFLDSHNLPEFDTHQFEGRIEKPLPRPVFFLVGSFFLIVLGLFAFKLWGLQIVSGKVYAERSENNHLDRTLLFSDRGVVYDRNNVPLAWNEVNPDNSDFSLRSYSTLSGLSSVLGFVKYPSKDTSGVYYQEDYVGKDGVEKAYNDLLSGVHGTKLVEVDASNKIQSESVLNEPKAGQNLTLSIDSRIQHFLYDEIASLSGQIGFTGGAGVMMNIKTGEVVAKVSYPEYDSNVMTEGSDADTINQYLKDPNNPFLDRTVDGLYTPGSIVKPFMALAALGEHIIDPNKKLVTTGSISIQNPYQPGSFTLFKDWRDQGSINMYDALAVSSDVYFYEVGGGYQDQKGVGISNIDKYLSLFGFGKPVNVPFFNGSAGTIPSPAWKADHFDGEAWTLGDTYHTAIGQYGFQVSPIQAVRAVSAIATEGTIHEPTIEKAGPSAISTVDIPKGDFDVVREGMRQAVTTGIISALKVPYIDIAAKTGTAELGVSKQQVNSWVTGFFPYNDPQYAFAVIMERGPVQNTIGATYVIQQLLNWMSVNTPEYFKAQ